MGRKSLRMDTSLVTKFIGFLFFISSSVTVCSGYVQANLSPAQVGLLVNFSVPCDLNIAIDVPDHGGLLTPVLLGVGHQEYRFNGSAWTLINEQAELINKSLAVVGSLFTSPNLSQGTVTFQVGDATVVAIPAVSVSQAFSIPLQLLVVASAVNQSAYYAAGHVQRFGTQAGLPPGPNYNGRGGEVFYSYYTAFYAFYLPFNVSPQLATRVPRCGDERFYGLQYGRTFP